MSKPDASAGYKIGLILWCALLSSTIVYPVISFVIKAPEGFEPAEGFEMIIGAMSVVAVSSAVMSFVMKHIIFGKQLKAGQATRQTWQTGHLVAWAMSESVAILGLVLYMLSYQQMYMVPFVLGSWLLFALHFPKKSTFESVRP